MRISTKPFLIPVFSVLFCYGLTGCKEKKEEYNSKNEFVGNDDLGIYKDGRPALSFLKETHQYYCNPNEGILRITDNEGTKDVTIKLSAVPTETEVVSGTVSGNMGITGFSFTGLKIVKSDNQSVWLWSDKDQTGFILPSDGIR